jgi:hypothetical protein
LGALDRDPWSARVAKVCDGTGLPEFAGPVLRLSAAVFAQQPERFTNVQTTQGASAVFDHYVTDGDGISAAAQANLPVYAYSDLPRAYPNAKKQAEYLEEVVTEFLTRVV